ncbi:MAG: Fic family protein [Gammaproteobacteria bacterium]|nr:Fic family protein [Gammaproteobacteria bacterium]
MRKCGFIPLSENSEGDLADPDRTFEQFFARLTGGRNAHRWQSDLAAPEGCGNRLIRIPTGFGKTLGVLAAWCWHRLERRDVDWPRRLVWCLPMRVLVEQTEHEVRSALERIGMLWDGQGSRDGTVGVHPIMGGANAGRWHLFPECEAVLVGTQDMLLSRALNRGYACPRARWPMEFGLLNQDALWVMDEVQLMDVGLATSGQLQVFRDADRSKDKSVRPCETWWMSATLQRAWLDKSPDATELAKQLGDRTHRIEPAHRVGAQWAEGAKPLSILTFGGSQLARHAAKRHIDMGCGKTGPTLVVVNTVERAVQVWDALRRDGSLKGERVDVRLAHSRYRPAERRSWREEFLHREACGPGTNRIIVATQVVEAGVDISASLLITELAPWPSLVQRFGRCARWGGTGRVVVVDLDHKTDKQAAPYSLTELAVARDACGELTDAGPLHLERFEEARSALLRRLYPYEPAHLLLRHELDELFDTTPDLSGADIDISRFIRSGEERDVQVFWSAVGDEGPAADLKPTRDELCSVPFLKARDWLCQSGQAQGLKPDARAWVWDWLDREWRTADRRSIYPGQTVLVDAKFRGYRTDAGWDPKSDLPVEPIAATSSIESEDYADDAEDDESLSAVPAWQTIAGHGLQVGEEVKRIGAEVAPEFCGLLNLAGRWHDLGKAHHAFQRSIQADDRPRRSDIAKAPAAAWPRPRDMYRIDATDQRRGFRHELASTLGLLAVLQRHDPEHAALLGPWLEWFAAMGQRLVHNGHRTDVCPTVVEREILDLGADEFDLLAYLVCAHHGKVRTAWHAGPADQNAKDSLLRIRGVCEGDILPPLPLAGADGEIRQLPATALDLSASEAGLNPRTGRSWTERVLRLIDRIGPFGLALLETILRAADQRASAKPIQDKLLGEQETADAELPLAGSHSELAHTAAGGPPPAEPGGYSASRRELHGDGGRARGRGEDSGVSRAAYSGTRYIETTAGILSHRELAPLLANRVADAELQIALRTFGEVSVHELLLELHRRVCTDLTPEIAGRWRLRNVRVGSHVAPPYWQVPVLMRNFTDDVAARMAAWGEVSDERHIEDLIFAEGRLLHIHPFEDFNGRVTRLFLVELLHRLGLPQVEPVAGSPEETERHLQALRAYDRNDPGLLAAIWRRRFGHEDSA